MKKLTDNKYPINKIITERWSTRSFDGKPVEEDKINSVLEAARWAPSAFNAQPWRFIVGVKNSKEYNNILSTLVDWNIQWAKNAPVLILNVAEKKFSHNGTSNPTYKYDLGQAVAIMSIEATNQGLFTHQMTGFNSDKAHQLFNLNEDLDVVSVTALGYYSPNAVIPEDIAKLEKNPRERKNVEDMLIK